jgi:Bardet-Biedl syndrome 2 protein
VFREEEMVTEVTEADRVLGLAAVGKVGRFAYALHNGTVGVYNKASRVWRVKGKHSCTCLAAFDIDANGLPEVRKAPHRSHGLIPR